MFQDLISYLGGMFGNGMSSQTEKPAGMQAVGGAPGGAGTVGESSGAGTTRAGGAGGAGATLSPAMLALLMQQFAQPQKTGFAPAPSAVRPTTFQYIPPAPPASPPQPQQQMYQPLGR